MDEKCLKIQFLPRRKHCAFIARNSRFMLFREIIAVYSENSWLIMFMKIIAVYSENHTKLLNSLYGKKVQTFLMLKLIVDVVTILL
jgi:hypothetical protein